MSQSLYGLLCYIFSLSDGWSFWSSSIASLICLQGLHYLLSFFCKAMCFSSSLYFTLFHYSSQWFILSCNISHPLHLFYIPPQDVLSVCLYYSLYHFYLHHCILVDHSIDSFGFCPNSNTTNYLVDGSFPGLLQLVSDSMDHHQSSHSDLLILIKAFYDRSLPPWLETSFNKFMKLHIYNVWPTLGFLDQSTEGSFFSSTQMTLL